jgi:hypothetical protein
VAGSVCEESSGSSSGSGATRAALVAFGHELQAFGVTVGEHPAFGGVNPVHTANSWHYRSGALDLNYDGHQGGEKAMLDSLVPLARARGFRIIWQYPGHYDHMHIDIGTGPDLGNFK